MANVFLPTIFGLIVMLHSIDRAKGRILEKAVSTCNGPCGQLALSCPVGQRIAIRDAVYSVQKRTPTCRTFKNCSNPRQEVCCEQTSQDCTFMYPREQLKMLHRNCSGHSECNIQTERWDIETVQCPATNTQVSSQTTLNYICINDSMVSEVCSSTEATIHGRTLFAMMNPRGSHKPIAGSVCTCIAETVAWPTTNTITVFLVDVRLNSLASSDCSNASLSVRSGNNDKAIHCDSKNDSRTNLPFVAVLNNSNVATLTLEINHKLPEFVLLGFESNEKEDIRLSCKLQGLSLVSPTDGSTLRDLDAIFDSNSPNTGAGAAEKSKISALIGGIVAGVILVAALVAIVVVLIIRKRKSAAHNSTTDDQQPEYDFTYYSTMEETLRNFQNTPERPDELYVSAEEVVANKRKSNPMQTGVTFKEVNVSESTKTRTNKDDITPSRQSTKDDNYDRLNRQSSNTCDTSLESYDQLVPERRASNECSYSSAINSPVSQKKHHPEINRMDSNSWVVNDAYDDTDYPELPEKFRSDVQGKHRDYFKMEKAPKISHSNATYMDMDGRSPRSDRANVRSTKQPHSNDAFTWQQTDDIGHVYNDAESEIGGKNQTRPRVNPADLDRANNTKVDVDVGVGENGISRAAGSQTPVAAPRRKSRVNVVAK